MALLFDGLKSYGGKWEEKSSRKFTAEEISLVEKAQVVPSEYGNSCCFFMRNGTTMYVPMDNNAKSQAGDFVDLSTADIVTLSKMGERDIQRIRG